MTIDAYRAKAQINYLSKQDVMEHFEYLKDSEYFEEVQAFVDEKVFGHKHGLVFTNHGRKVTIQCTKCGHEEVTYKAPKHAKDAICEGCGITLKAKNSKYNATWCCEYQDVIYFRKSSLDAAVLVGHQISIKQAIKEVAGKATMVYEYANTAYYVFDYAGKNLCVYESHWSNETHFTKTVYAVNSGKSYFWGIAIDSLLNAAKGTPYEYILKHADVGPYLKDPSQQASHIIKLLDNYKTGHTAIELLYSAGFDAIANSKICGRRNYAAINWKGKSITEALKLPMGMIRHFKPYLQDGLNATENLKLIQVLHRRKHTREEIEDSLNLLEQTNNIELEHFLEILVDKPSRMFNYFSKQLANYPKTYSTLGSVARDFYDMLQDYKELDLKITTSRIYPKDLNQHHINLQKQIEIKANKQLDAEFKKRAKSLKKLMLENSDFLIKAFESSKELIEEGASLSHCVGRYAKRHADGETTILAVRKKDEPGKHFYTMEIDLKRKELIQCRGYKNKSYTHDPKLAEFVDGFINMVLKGRSNDKQSKRAS